MKTRNTLFIGLALMMSLFAMACDLDSESECDPEFDEGCFCTLDDDGVTDVTDECIDGETDDLELCTCLFEEDDDFDPNNPNPDPNPDNEPTSEFRFVMVEDMTVNRGGDFPGADVDAVSILKSDGVERFATSIGAETDIDCADNFACDPSGLLGAPDAVLNGECFGGSAQNIDPGTFTALNGGFAVVRFDGSSDVTINNGDSIRVYEIGATQCNGSFDDDPYRVSVSISDSLGTFIEVGSGGAGTVNIPISGL